MNQRRVLVSAWAGMGNLGDDWLIQTLVNHMPSHIHPTLLLEPGADAPHDNAAVLRWPSISRSSLGDWRAFRRDVADFDGVVFAGGGWLAGDQGLRSPLRWGLRLRQLQAPIFGIGIGVGPFPGRGSRIVARQVLREFDRLVVRTSSDQAWVESITGASCGLSGDLTLLGSALPQVDPGRTGVVVCMPAPRSHWWSASDEEYASAVLELANRCTDHDQVDFVHFQLGRNGDREYWSRFGIDSRPLTVTEALARLRLARVVIAGRLHAAIAAAVSGAGVIPLGYHHKFQTLGAIGITPYRMVDVLGQRLEVTTQSVSPDAWRITRASLNGHLRDIWERVGARS